VSRSCLHPFGSAPDGVDRADVNARSQLLRPTHLVDLVDPFVCQRDVNAEVIGEFRNAHDGGHCVALRYSAALALRLAAERGYFTTPYPLEAPSAVSLESLRLRLLLAALRCGGVSLRFLKGLHEPAWVRQGLAPYGCGLFLECRLFAAELLNCFRPS
jgi:hypothetical protein